MIDVRRIAGFACALAVLGVVVAGCGSGEASDDQKSSSAGMTAGEAAREADGPSTLIMKGRRVDPEGEPRSDEVGPRRAGGASRVRRELSSGRRDGRTEPQAPPLLADGTIDDGPDPFEDSYVPVQAIPIEDDPYTTSTIETAAMRLRRIDLDVWQDWLYNSNARSPFQQTTDPTASALVEVSVERCGGARQVATGVVLDDETVVTNVHVVENAAKRIRIAQAASSDSQRRIPAMIRYLDVDDDIAVLKVPGLRIAPMLWHAVVHDRPIVGYAFGVAPGGRAGTLRRVPVVATQSEETIRVEQPDGFARQIRDRPVQTLVGGISSGFSGGVVAATNDPTLQTQWGFHGLLRARMSLRADTAGIVVPSRLVEDALDANDRLDEWFEIRPGHCPQWER